MENNLIGNEHTEGQVTVKLVPSAVVPHGMAIKISVRAVTKPSALMVTDLELVKFTSKEQIERAVNIAGGACAEQVAERFGDLVDPSRCAADAVKAWAEVLKQPSRHTPTMH